MGTTVFDDGDGPYQRWMLEHPAGFVANTERSTGSRYFVMHRSACSHIRTHSRSQPPGCFTTRAYIKVRCDTCDEIRAWFAANRRNAESAKCQAKDGR